MSFDRGSRQNPVLEIKRDAYLAEEKEFRDDLLDSYKQSILKVKHLHANLLFSTVNGLLILKSICRSVTQIEPSVYNKNWKDFAVDLGYTDADVKCINNLRGGEYDPTEAVLKYYANSNDEGTIGNVLQALLDNGILPAVHQAQPHIDELLAEVETIKSQLIRNYHNTDDTQVKNVIKAANFKPHVPAIFQPDVSCKKTVTKLVDFSVVSNREVELYQRSAPQYVVNNKPKKQYCKYVMLSFAGDGHATALKVASALRAKTNKKGYPIGVLMLCENENLIQGNPGQILADIVSKMDFVVPILTKGYFAALKNPDCQARLLDERFVQYIHDILVSKYIHNNCLNLQVRPVIPSFLINSVYNMQEFQHNSIFNAWKTDEELPSLANNIVKSHRSKILPQ